MPSPAEQLYAEAFDSRCAAVEREGSRRVDGPGIRGLVGAGDGGRTQLLVLDDRAVDLLAAVLPSVSAGTVRVLEAAPRCAELLRLDGGWTPKSVTAMVCGDLRSLPDVVLPGGISLRPVRRVPEDAADGVPLADAVRAAALAAPAGEIAPDGLAAYLASLSDDVRLLAAVDDDGAVLGTSGSRTFSADAFVIFVNTVPAWRRRGVGLAMTAAALRSAREAGASRACLDASAAGIPLYERLGFAAAGRLTQFSRD